MTWNLLATSCTDGSCPTFFVNAAGDVKVRGYDPDHVNDPGREFDVVIPAAKWAALMASMPSGGQ